jgi:hypothetical protein
MMARPPWERFRKDKIRNLFKKEGFSFILKGTKDR